MGGASVQHTNSKGRLTTTTAENASEEELAKLEHKEDVRGNMREIMNNIG